jgi:hypothetical protein
MIEKLQVKIAAFLAAGLCFVCLCSCVEAEVEGIPMNIMSKVLQNQRWSLHYRSQLDFMWERVALELAKRRGGGGLSCI